MKKLILAAALLLAAVGSSTTINKFQDPVMECPPNCLSGNVIASIG
ncbi:MAG TPA: hypothetical protein VGL72_23810 [Bryobacteraceae bacterium]